MSATVNMSSQRSRRLQCGVSHWTISYERQRDTDEGGRVVRGLRFARNVGVHYLPAVHMLEPRSDSSSVPSLESSIEARWTRRDDLERTPRKSAGNEAAYDHLVAGRSVLEPLTAAQEFLCMRAMPLPPGTASQPWLPPPWLPQPT